MKKRCSKGKRYFGWWGFKNKKYTMNCKVWFPKQSSSNASWKMEGTRNGWIPVLVNESGGKPASPAKALAHSSSNCATKCSSSTSVSTGDQQLPPRTAGWKMCNRAAPVKPLICKESWCHTTSHNTVNSQDESLSRRKTSGTEQTLSSKEESLWTAHRLRLKPKSATTPRTLL